MIYKIKNNLKKVTMSNPQTETPELPRQTRKMIYGLHGG